jgi:hypothetical protein
VALVYSGLNPPVKFQPTHPDAPECFYVSLNQCQYFKLESYDFQLSPPCVLCPVSWCTVCWVSSHQVLSSFLTTCRMLTPEEQKILSQY